MTNEIFFEEIPDNADNPSKEIPKEETTDKQTTDTDSSAATAEHRNAIQSDEYSFTTDKNTTYRISLPSLSLFNFSAKLKEINKLNIEEPTAELKNWKTVTEQAVDFYTVGGLYQNRFQDTKSEFKQGVEDKEGHLSSIGSVKFKKTEGELKGEIALLKVSKVLGLGDVIHIPLPHSGIWVTIKPPTETDLIDFYNSIFREKIMLGRSTYGLTLSNFSVYINNRFFDFILKHIYSINYGDIEKSELRNYLLIHDFPILAWGFACTMYPNGYDYQRACVNDIQNCTHIAKATLNLTKLLWVDNPSLTEAQKIILAEGRPNRLTLEHYRKFITEHTRVTSSTFTTDNGITFKLKIPTFNEYTVDGLAWINKINTAVENVIIEETSREEEEKTELLNQYIKSSILRQFNHFIDYIEFEDNVISDRDTINKVLEAFSGEDSLRNQITENILKFKVKTTLGIIGIPEYKCPNCGQPQNKTADERFTSVIPLDVMSVVFLLLTSKISKILAREV